MEGKQVKCSLCLFKHREHQPDAQFSPPRIMDRNLGAMDIYYHGADGHYGDLYYQFGRKDPFSGDRKIYIRNEDGSYSFETWSTGTYTIPNTTADANCNNVPYSIKHPLTFIKSNAHDYWTYNDIYNPTAYNSAIRWQDPYVTSDSGKSMFDPCPAGWKVPKNGTWTGFTTSNFLWNNPLSIGRNDPISSAFYPAAGFLANGGFSSIGQRCLYWNCSPYSAASGFCSDSNSGGVQPTVSFDRAYAFSVRCVQE